MNASDPSGADTYGTSSSAAIDAYEFSAEQEVSAVANGQSTSQWCPIVSAGSTQTGRLKSGLNASSTPSDWATDVLKGIGVNPSILDLAAFDAWEQAEGGNGWGGNNYEAYNPLNLNYPEGSGNQASIPVRPLGLMAYRSGSQGLAATVATLRQARFLCTLQAAFYSPNPGQALSDVLSVAPFANVWGNGPGQSDGPAVLQWYNAEVPDGPGGPITLFTPSEPSQVDLKMDAGDTSYFQNV